MCVVLLHPLAVFPSLHLLLLGYPYSHRHNNGEIGQTGTLPARCSWWKKKCLTSLTCLFVGFEFWCQDQAKGLSHAMHALYHSATFPLHSPKYEQINKSYKQSEWGSWTKAEADGPLCLRVTVWWQRESSGNSWKVLLWWAQEEWDSPASAAMRTSVSTDEPMNLIILLSQSLICSKAQNLQFSDER